MPASDFNTQIYSQQASPMENMGRMANFMNLMNQNRLFQQQFNTNLGVSQIYKEAIDPTTGQIDTNKLQSLLADPGTSQNVTLGLPQAIQQSQAARLQQLQITGQQYDNAMKRWGALSNAAAPLLEKYKSNPGALTQQDVFGAFGDLVSSGAYTPQELAIALHGNPQNGIPAAPQGGQELYNWVSGKYLQGLDHAQQIQMMYGPVQSTNAGGVTLFTQTPQMGGSTQLRGAVQNTMTPGEASELVTTKDPTTGQPMLNTRGNIVGQIRGQQPQQMGGSSSAIPSSAFGANGSVKGVPSGPSPAMEAYQEGAGGNMVQYEKNVNDRVSAGYDMMQRIDEARRALQEARTGGGQEAYMRLAQVAQAIPGMPQGVVDRLARGNLGASQEFEKLMVTNTMNQLRQALQGTGGSRINRQEFEAFKDANPNLDTDPRAVDKVFNFLTNVYQRDLAEQDAFRGWVDQGNNPADFPSHWQQEAIRRGFITPQVTGAGTSKAQPQSAPKNRPPIGSFFGQ